MTVPISAMTSCTRERLQPPSRGRFLGLPTIAVSLCTEPGSARNFRNGRANRARPACHLTRAPLRTPRRFSTSMCRTGPAQPCEESRRARLGFRHRSAPVVRAEDPRGRPIVLGGSGRRGAGSGTGEQTSMPWPRGLSRSHRYEIDLTRHAAIDEVGHWLRGIDG